MPVAQTDSESSTPATALRSNRISDASPHRRRHLPGPQDSLATLRPDVQPTPRRQRGLFGSMFPCCGVRSLLDVSGFHRHHVSLLAC